jgi:tRNA dimethylallyltransferase
MKRKPRIIAVVGPTASGKSDLAVLLAQKFNGEVVSADSRQVYRGMDIGTGKITSKEMCGVPHYLLDVVSPRRVFSVAEYKQQADNAIAAVVKHGRLPILCGGTGFYVDAVTQGMVLPEVPPDPILRKELSAHSAEKLFAMLQTIDEERAATIDSKNPYRLIRALEIAKTLGKVPLLKKDAPYDTLFVGITAANDLLRERIHIRLQKRMKQGMAEEAERLHKSGLSWKRMEEIGLEYRYLSRFLRGALTKEEMLAQLEQEIMNYAKRQYTWFRRNKHIHWIERDETAKAQKLVDDFLS